MWVTLYETVSFTGLHRDARTHWRATPSGNSSKYRKVTLHEIAHPLGGGRADDEELFQYTQEVYSGSGGDKTPKAVGYSGLGSDRWSVLGAGWNDAVNSNPMDGRYVVFSIEELSTIECSNIQTVE